jgi:uncharacterized membrane protein
MAELVDQPLLLLVVSFVALLLAAAIGVVAEKVWNLVKSSDHNELAIVQSAAVTLLGLIVGFTFAMAISRYDQRKVLEEAEANAIGTEYLRVGLMPDSAASNARGALKHYLDLRIQYYLTTDQRELTRIGAERAKLEADLWAAMRSQSEASPTAITMLVAWGLNDVFNSTDATAAAWLDRIPIPAWWLLAMIAIGANVMLGVGARRFNSLLLVVPLAVSVSFFLIADIDSPRGGVVQVKPENLDRLAASLSAAP